MDCCLFISFTAASHLLAKACVGLIGAAALYCACFLYEDEEGRLQNRVEQLWVEIADKRRSGEQAPLAAKAAKIISRLLDTVLGKRLLSIQMITMSICLSWSILFIALLVGLAMGKIHPKVLHPVVGYGTLLLVLSVFIAIILRRPHSRVLYYVFYFPILIVIAVCIYSDMSNNALHKAYPWMMEAVYVAIVISIFSDMLFISITRWSLGKLSQRATFQWLLVTILIQIMTIMAIFAVPLALAILAEARHSSSAVLLGLESVFALNLFTISVQLIFIAVILFLQVHLLFWPAIERGTYAIARFKIVTNRKALMCVSIACFAVISPPFAELLKKASEWFK